MFDECFYQFPNVEGIAAGWVVSKYSKTSKFTPLTNRQSQIYTETSPVGKSFVYVGVCPSAKHL